MEGQGRSRAALRREKKQKQKQKQKQGQMQKQMQKQKQKQRQELEHEQEQEGDEPVRKKARSRESCYHQHGLGLSGNVPITNAHGDYGNLGNDATDGGGGSDNEALVVVEDRRPVDRCGVQVAVPNGTQTTMVDKMQYMNGRDIAACASLDGMARSAAMFEWLIAPVSRETFYARHWERRPLLVRRNFEDGDGGASLVSGSKSHGHSHSNSQSKPDYYRGWLDKAHIDLMLGQRLVTADDSDSDFDDESDDGSGSDRQKKAQHLPNPVPLQYGTDVDLTRYEFEYSESPETGGLDANGVKDKGAWSNGGKSSGCGQQIQWWRRCNGTRHTLNPAGDVDRDTVWRHFAAGCSLRLVRPQQHSERVWRLLHALQGEWGSMAGANAYYTPRYVPESTRAAPVPMANTVTSPDWYVHVLSHALAPAVFDSI
eukprot:g482.t1